MTSTRLRSLVLNFLCLITVVCLITINPTEPATGVSLKKVASFSDHTSPVSEVKFVPGKTQITSATHAGAVHLWDYKTKKKISKIPFLEHNTTDDWLPMAAVQYFMKALGWNPLASPINALSYPPMESNRLAVGYLFETTVRVLNQKTKAQLQTFPTQSGTTDLEFSPEGVFLAVLDWDAVTIWNTVSGKKHRRITDKRFEPEGPRPLDIDYSPRGKYLALSWRNGEVQWWKVRTGKHTETLQVSSEDENTPGRSTHVGSIDIHPTGRKLLTVSWDETFETWSFPDGERIGRKEIPGSLPNDAEFSPQGNIFAIAQGRKLSFWETKTRELLLEKKIHQDSINTLDFSSSGKYIATGAGYIGNDAEDNTVTVWENPFYKDGSGKEKSKLR